MAPEWWQVLSGRPLMNNEEDNADGTAFASAADFQDKVYETH